MVIMQFLPCFEVFFLLLTLSVAMYSSFYSDEFTCSASGNLENSRRVLVCNLGSTDVVAFSSGGERIGDGGGEADVGKKSTATMEAGDLRPRPRLKSRAA